MKQIVRLLLFVFLTAFMPMQSQETENQIEGFDPNTLNDPGPDWPLIISSGIQLETQVDREEQTEIEIQIINGFRVQVLATRYAQKADSLKMALSERISEEIYITFEAPNYKVRVGDCTDRKQAEELQDRMQAEGFPAAWIIRERIEWQQ